MIWRPRWLVRHKPPVTCAGWQAGPPPYTRASHPVGLQNSAFGDGSWARGERGTVLCLERQERAPQHLSSGQGGLWVQRESLTGLVVSIRFSYWLVGALVTRCREEKPGRRSQVLELPSL